MWTSQSVFISTNAYSFSDLNKADTHAILSRLNGIFFTYYELTQISGNLVSSFVLNRDEYNSTSASTQCGCNDCPDVASENGTSKIVEPSSSTVYLMLSIFLAFDFLGFLCTVIFLPSIPKSEWAEQSNTKESITACFSALWDPKLVLLVPFISIMAMEQAVLWTDFTKSYISCSYGIQMVGFVMASYGCATTVSAFVTSRIAKYTGRYILFGIAVCIDMAIFVLLFVWVPKPDQKEYVFAIAVVWGLSEGIFQTQSNALIALLFPEKTEAAFANYHCTKAASFTVYFVISLYFCVKMKLIIVIALLTVGSLLYIGVEVHVHRRRETEKK